jgi:hypothetical protein
MFSKDIQSNYFFASRAANDPAIGMLIAFVGFFRDGKNDFLEQLVMFLHAS